MDKFEMNTTEKLQGNPEGLEREGYREAGEMAIEATETSLREMSALTSQTESMERRQFRDAVAEAKDDRGILAAKEKLNELRAKLGLEPVELVVNREARIEKSSSDLGGGMPKSDVVETEEAVADVVGSPAEAGEREAMETNWGEAVKGEGLMAANGELDLSAPELMTRATMTEAATEYLVQQMQFDSNLAREINEESQKALERAEQTSGDTTETLSAAEREKKIGAISEKLERRHSAAFGKFARRAMAAAMAAVLAISLTGCALLGVDSDAVKKGKVSADILQGMIDKGEGATIEGGLIFDCLGDLSVDKRFEHTNGTRYDYSQDYLRMSEKHGPNNFSVDMSEHYGDREGTIDSMMGVFRNQPESLAAGVSPYKSVLRAAGLTGDETAIEIDKMLSDEQGGGKLQERLLEAFEAMLRDEKNTSFEFYREYNDEQSYYMYNMKGNAGETNPSTMQLNLVEVDRNGEAQVMIRHFIYDAEGEVIGVESGDYNMPCGYQLNKVVKDPGTSTWVEIAESDPEELPKGDPDMPETGTPDEPGGPENPRDPDPSGPNNPLDPAPGKPSTSDPIIPGGPGVTPEEQPPVSEQPAGVTQKNPQNQIDVVQNGGQTGKVEQSSGPGESTETTTTGTGSAPVISGDTTQTIINTAVDGTDAEAAAAAAAKAAEEKAAAEAAAAKAAAEKAAEEAKQKADAEAAAEAARLEAAARAAEEAAAKAKAEAEAAAKAEAEAKAAAEAAKAAQDAANANEITGNMSDEDFNTALGDLGFN